MPHTQKHNSRAHQFPESCPYYPATKEDPENIGVFRGFSIPNSG